MARNVITFITLAALACLTTVSGQFTLPADVYCTTSNNLACTQLYPNTVCHHEEQVCKYGDSCKCATGYAKYSFYNSTSFFIEYSCRPATVLVGDWCNNTLRNTCSGYRTYCQQYTDTYSVCECLGNYKPNADRTDCIPLELKQNCTNGECGVNAYCDSSMLCRCKPGYKAFNATDCTHYEPGDKCPDTECDFTESRQSCGYGTCKGGVFGCIPGSTWWRYGTLEGEEPSALVNGMCLKNTVTVVSNGDLCDSDVQQTSDYACRSNRCVTCPEQRDVYICNASNGATSSKTISAATSLILLLACYLFH